MTKLELLERLKNEGFPEDSYNLEGGDYDKRLCLERKNNRWFVYYSDRGIRTNENDFFLEELACEYYYEILKALTSKIEY